MKWILLKSSGSRWSLNSNIIRENNLSLSFWIIYLVLDIPFKIYHVTSTNIDLAELIFAARLDELISLGGNNKSINASIIIHMVGNTLTIFPLKNPFSIASLWINLKNSFVPWVHKCIISYINIQ